MAKKEKKIVAAKPPKPEKKKGKNKGNESNTRTFDDTTIDTSQLTPDQLQQVQLEKAIKESSDPSSKLKRLKNPISIGGCLLQIVLLLVITLAIVYLVIWIKVDQFDFIGVTYDILKKFGIIDFFGAIGNWFKSIFGG